MTDFASTAMVRVLHAGMRSLGLDAPALPLTGARVSLDDKRRLVQAALAQGGWSALLRIGQGVQAIRGDPVHQALVASRSPAELLARWCRLERYIHSRHRLDVQADGAALDVSHRSLRAGEPPLPHEDLVVLGVLAAAMAEAGMSDLRVAMAGVPVWPEPDEAALQRLVAHGRTGRWRLEANAAGQAADRPAATTVQRVASDWTDPPPARALAEWLLADPMRSSSLGEAARELGQAPRSLQRALAQHGLTYSEVMARTRCSAAAWHLVHTALGTAETGFVCGYSDQAHFTRQFRQRVGVTPAAYRREFAAASGATGLSLTPHAAPVPRPDSSALPPR